MDCMTSVKLINLKGAGQVREDLRPALYHKKIRRYDMEEKRRRLLKLYEAWILSRKNIRRLLLVDPELTEIEKFSKTELIHYGKLTENSAAKIHHWLKQKPFDQQCGDKITLSNQSTFFDSDFPPSLRNIPDSPLVLYYRGNFNLAIHAPSLSVVGTRRPSQEAKQKMNKILSPLIDKNWCIVSGMARGIDSYAHYLALSQKGCTIAILGSGFSYIYPPENHSLFHQLSKDHLVLSEYPDHIAPQRYFFPERNRLISGLSFATLVVEAEQRSGSLITADQALEQGKDVFAIPGSPLIPQAQGVNSLIQQGAKLINHAEDILEEWES